jgi:hypothetical protein
MSFFVDERWSGTLNRHPFLILRSMADLLLSNQRLFQSEDLYAFTLSHDESSLYIISIAY